MSEWASGIMGSSGRTWWDPGSEKPPVTAMCINTCADVLEFKVNSHVLSQVIKVGFKWGNNLMCSLPPQPHMNIKGRGWKHIYLWKNTYISINEMQFSSPAASFNLYTRNYVRCIRVHVLKQILRTHSHCHLSGRSDLEQSRTKSLLCRNTMSNELQVVSAWKIVEMGIVFPYDLFFPHDCVSPGSDSINSSTSPLCLLKKRFV